VRARIREKVEGTADRKRKEMTERRKEKSEEATLREGQKRGRRDRENERRWEREKNIVMIERRGKEMRVMITAHLSCALSSTRSLGMILLMGIDEGHIGEPRTRGWQKKKRKNIRRVLVNLHQPAPAGLVGGFFKFPSAKGPPDEVEAGEEEDHVQERNDVREQERRPWGGAMPCYRCEDTITIEPLCPLALTEIPALEQFDWHDDVEAKEAQRRHLQRVVQLVFVGLKKITELEFRVERGSTVNLERGRLLVSKRQAQESRPECRRRGRAGKRLCSPLWRKWMPKTPAKEDHCWEGRRLQREEGRVTDQAHQNEDEPVRQLGHKRGRQGLENGPGDGNDKLRMTKARVEKLRNQRVVSRFGSPPTSTLCSTSSRFAFRRNPTTRPPPSFSASFADDCAQPRTEEQNESEETQLLDKSCFSGDVTSRSDKLWD
jgi:hypothetical protein